MEAEAYIDVEGDVEGLLRVVWRVKEAQVDWVQKQKVTTGGCNAAAHTMAIATAQTVLYCERNGDQLCVQPLLIMALLGSPILVGDLGLASNLART